MNIRRITPERLLLMYGLPCLKHIKLCDNLDKDKKIKKNVIDRFFKGYNFSQSELRGLFVIPFKFIKKGYLLISDVEDYFLNKHNKVVQIHAKDRNKAYWCTTKIAKITGITKEFGAKDVIVSYDGHNPDIDKHRIYENPYGLELKLKQEIIIHWQTVIAKYDSSKKECFYVR